jgi:dienelactone hydrolase
MSAVFAMIDWRHTMPIAIARNRLSAAHVLVLMLTWILHAHDAAAGQLVEFGTPSDTTSTKLLGYLTKPDGAGPFPAVVILHGCSGLLPSHTLMAERLRLWGYVALAIDSLGPRGQSNASASGSHDQPVDAYSGLNFLAAQPFVDPDRIGLLGYSMGGGSAMVAVERGTIEQLFARKFRAVIAYYPAFCKRETGIMTAPTLILIGALDDWTPAQECQEMVKRASDKGVTIDNVVYPNAYHAFDLAELPPGWRYMGHRLEYDESAAKDSWIQTRRFLDGHLAANAKH